jgi:hypothetical protein
MNVPVENSETTSERLARLFHVDWLIIAIVAIMFSVFDVVTLTFVESHDIQNNNLIGDKAPPEEPVRAV